ncbi:plant UBX domain-containing protein 8-like [Wolffia australiana]
MGRPEQEAVETFMSVTGASEAVSLQKLEEYGGDLSAALNAHFSEEERANLLPVVTSSAYDDDVMDVDQSIDIETVQPSFPILSASRFDPFSLMEEHIGRTSFGRRGNEGIRSRAPRVSHPREVREIPIEFKDSSSHSGLSNNGPNVEYLAEDDKAVGPTTFGHVAMVEEDEEEEQEPVSHDVSRPGETKGTYDDHHRTRIFPESSASQVSLVAENNDIEEEMIKAAIEASKHDSQMHLSSNVDVLNTSEEIITSADKGSPFDQIEHGSSSVVVLDEKTTAKSAINRRRQESGASTSVASKPSVAKEKQSNEEVSEDLEEQQLVRRPSRHTSFQEGSSSKVAIQLDDSSPSSPQTRDVGMYPQLNGTADEWGGMTSEEHDEAVMLEAAMFGGVPERETYKFSYPNHSSVQVEAGRHTSYNPWANRPPSPTLAAQRSLREQQDDEYQAALQADREKDLKLMQEAELRRLEEITAREAAAQQERHQEEEMRKIKLEEEELERALNAKLASLPVEPSANNENAVTLLVRMPDGSRHGRRFLKSDKLQSLFDFIDTGRLAKPQTYRLVRPYPRRAFGKEESNLSLCELGLTSKQEALFLELI